jgi:hypothetical protein
LLDYRKTLLKLLLLHVQMLSEMILGSVAMTHQVGNMKLHLLGKDTFTVSRWVGPLLDNPIIRYSVNSERINSLAEWWHVRNTG